MEIQQVRYFLEVCSERNFTRAAKKCGISQPSLTRAIKLLEAEFGGILFDREHRNVGLTALGKLVHPYLQGVWEQASAVKKLTGEISAKKSGQVRLGVMCTISPKLLIEVVADFRNRHRQAELEIVDGTADALERKLLHSEIDIAVFARPKRRPNGRLNYLRLFREQMMIIVPRSHRFAAMPRIPVSDLPAENYVMRALCEFGEPAESADEETITWKAAYKSDRDDWVYAMIASGFGFGFVPRYSVPVHENFEVIPVVEPEFWRDINLVTVIDRPHTSAVGALVHEFSKRNWPRE